MKVVISGYGKMGHVVERVLVRRGIELALATEDVCSVNPALANECVCIDFTTPDAFRANYQTLAHIFKAVVIGTTGWDDILPKVRAVFEREGTTMIYASNFSIGVNAFLAATARVCEVLKDYDYIPSVEEIHHNHKLDAPSGTAKTIASVISEEFSVRPEINSIREGDVPGTHTVRFLSDMDRIIFTHEAFSREGFAEGAVSAALMTERLVGVHEFKDLIL